MIIGTYIEASKSTYDLAKRVKRYYDLFDVIGLKVVKTDKAYCCFINYRKGEKINGKNY